MEDISPEKRAQLHEVSDLMLEIYRTLVRMRYLKPEWIHEGPHDLDAHNALHDSLNLDPTVRYLYRILPYVNNGAGPMSFFQGSSFADFRDERDVRDGRDPFFDGSDDEDEPPIKSWMTPLSLLGNHDSAIIYSARTNWIWIYDHESGYGASTDHNIRAGWQVLSIGGVPVQDVNDETAGQDTPTREPSPPPPAAPENMEDDGDSSSSHSEGGDTDRSDQEMEDTEVESVDDDDDDEEMDDEDEEWDEDDEDDDESGINGERYRHGNGRPAPDVLRDINLWFKELREYPRGEYSGWGSEWEEEDLPSLFTKHGWPGDDFDGDAFEVDRVRARATYNVMSAAGEILKRISFLKGPDIRFQEQGLATVREQLAAATTVDGEWATRWDVFRKERQLQRTREELKAKEAEAERLGLEEQVLPPHEVPLLEVTLLRRDLDEARRDLVRFREERDKPDSAYAKGYPAQRVQELEDSIPLHERAIEIVEADAKRLAPPGSDGTVTSENGLKVIRSFEPTDWRPILEGNVRDERENLEVYTAWLADVPDEAVSAKEKVEQQIKQTKAQIDAYLDRLARLK